MHRLAGAAEIHSVEAPASRGGDRSTRLPVRPEDAANRASPAPLRLQLSAQVPGLAVQVLKRRGGLLDNAILLPLTPPGDLALPARPHEARPPLWTALHLPRLALDVVERLRPPHDAGAPATMGGLVVTTQRRVVDCDKGARAAGIAPRMTMAAADALMPGLSAMERNPQAEAQAQHDLATWALGTTSTVVLHGADARIDAPLRKVITIFNQ